jgi:glycosyltransferase involved in cell wall biosynthesis
LNLILLTNTFPFGNGETFLETEIKYLCQGFEKVQILAVDPESDTMRSVPGNCTVHALYTKSGFAQKISALAGIFNPRTRAELGIIRKTYGISLNKGILSTLLISLQRAKDIQQQLLPFIENDSETVLYSYWCDDSALALALLSEERKELKTVCRIHGWDVYFDRSAIGYLPFRHYIHKQLSAIYSISEDGVNYAQKVWKVTSEKLKLSRLGIEAQEPLPQRTDGVFTLVSCSNLIPVKRVNLIAEAVKELDGRMPLRWVHIGDGPERLKIEQIVANLSAQTEVRFTGRLPNTEVFKLYRELCPDVFINVSSSEGVPVSIMEAMSYGIPVIATNVGGNSEIVNETNGFLVESQITAGELSEYIIQFVELQPEVKRLLSIQAYDTWKVKYNSMKNYNEFVTDLLLN